MSNIPDRLTIRWARPADLPELEQLAALDSKRLPAGPILVACVDGDRWAGYSVLDNGSFADPFRPSGDLVALLAKRAGQVREEQAPMPVMRLEPLLARLR